MLSLKERKGGLIRADRTIETNKRRTLIKKLARIWEEKTYMYLRLKPRIKVDLSSGDKRLSGVERGTDKK